jgi:hypothetical protein
MRARQFYMELLSSERAFNGWDDEQAAAASAQHFGRLLELMKVLPDLIAYYPMHSRRGIILSLALSTFYRSSAGFSI